MLSSLRLLIERAIAMDITKGKPSGIETISRTTAVITIFSRRRIESFETKSTWESNMMRNAKKMRLVTILRKVVPSAYYLICFEIKSSFCSSKVFCSTIFSSEGPFY